MSAVAGTFAVWLALLAGMLGRHYWLLDLFAHFRLQYLALFIVFAAILLVVRRRQMALLAVAGVLLSALPLLGSAGLPQSAVAKAGGPNGNVRGNVRGNFRLVTFNVWYRNRDYARVAEYLEATQADAIVLQECPTEQALELRKSLPSYPHAYLQAGVRHGAVLFSRWPISQGQVVQLSPQGVRAARVALQWRDSTVTVLGVHLHWPLTARTSALRNDELAGVAALAAAHDGPLLIAGDFNATQWSGYFRDALAQAGVNDCTAGLGMLTTWPAQFPPLGIRIDHCLASSHWRGVAAQSGPYLGSDHRPLVVDLTI
jgi:endonuclease/exonuclease/phosphatase (EEP) superfamily protein YafD